MTGAAAGSRCTSSCVTLAWAADHGIEEVYTWTQDGNAAMRALNTRLGYATTRVGIQLARPAGQD